MDASALSALDPLLTETLALSVLGKLYPIKEEWVRRLGSVNMMKYFSHQIR